MARDNLYYNLVHAAEVEECDAHKSLLYDAACEICRLQDENEDLKEKNERLMDKRNSMIVTVKLSAERVREAVNDAFVNTTGKDLEYVCRAVYEKMEREGELVGTEQETAKDS